MRTSSLGRRHLAAVFAAFAVGLGLIFAAAGVADGEEPDVTTSVVGGSAVPNGKYPFMVSLQLDRRGSSRADEHFCGGTLIGPRHVLTAGHCIKEMPITRKNYRKLRVVVGAANLNDTGQTRRVKSFSNISVHPRYKSTNYGVKYDAAVIRLSTPVNGVKPIKLAGGKDNGLEAKGSQATISGWGSTLAVSPSDPSPRVNYPDRMQEVRVPVGSDAFFKRSYGRGFVKPIMVGAGSGGEGVCYGDSGGPLFAPKNGQYKQIGITSFGIGCATSRYRGVFAEVNSPNIRSFIRRTSGA